MIMETYELVVGTLVIHCDRPESFGCVIQIENDVVGNKVYTVQWREYNYIVGEPERCLRDELIATECDGCGETECWCGVGR